MSRALKIKSFLKLSSYDSLLETRGSWINLISKLYPSQAKEFMDLNADLIRSFNIKSYLGSGNLGDAWELEDGKVLKIFPPNIETGGDNDYNKYSEIIKRQHSGKGSPYLPMVYELGRFNMPESFSGIIFPNPMLRRRGSGLELAYVVLEKVKTTNKMTGDYIQYTGNEDFVRPDQVGDNLHFEYRESKSEGTLSDFSKLFVIMTFDNIISIIKDLYLREKYKYLQALKEEGFSKREDFYDWSWPDSVIDLRKETELNLLKNKIEESIVQKIDEDKLLNIINTLNLSKEWKMELINSVIYHLNLGRLDLHGANMGLRGDKFVFFDS